MVRAVSPQKPLYLINEKVSSSSSKTSANQVDGISTGIFRRSLFLHQLGNYTLCKNERITVSVSQHCRDRDFLVFVWNNWLMFITLAQQRK